MFMIDLYVQLASYFNTLAVQLQYAGGPAPSSVASVRNWPSCREVKMMSAMASFRVRSWGFPSVDGCDDEIIEEHLRICLGPQSDAAMR
jgi:hypothetical protein